MVGYTYHYDQLNRLKKMRQYTGIAGTGTWDRSYITLNDQENITYDGNGNILTYGRNGGDTTAQTIDSLSYNYNYTGGKLANNQLQYIHDAVSSSGYDLDIRNQTNTNNYQYDPIGNIIKDIQSGITNTGWTVYNKPDTIYKSAGNITYTYNTANQRVSKTYDGLTTWYIRDAQGNVLSVYDNADSSINWREQHLYGSSRLGMWTPNVNLADSNALDTWQTTGLRQFELDNHLGNVMTTINDVRVPYFKPSHIGPLPGPLQYFTANVLSYTDYYAFGMLMPDRQYTMTGDSSYRYGFNGKENDNEVAGLGNSQDYGERFYDVRIGRFRSVDPIAGQYPELSSYQFASNSPISGIDIDGKEYLNASDALISISGSTVSLNLANFSRPSQSAWKVASEKPQNWPAGHIGLPTEVGELKLFTRLPTPEDVSLDNTYGANDPAYNSGNHNVVNPTAESTGLPDRRYNDQVINGASSSSTGGAVGLLAINAINWGLTEFANISMANDEEDYVSQLKLLQNQVTSDLNEAIAKGLIPQKYLNSNNLGDISNVILTGVNNTKDNGIYDIGIKIVKLISKNYRGPIPHKIFPLKKVDHTALKRPVVNPGN